MTKDDILKLVNNSQLSHAVKIVLMNDCRNKVDFTHELYNTLYDSKINFFISIPYVLKTDTYAMAMRKYYYHRFNGDVNIKYKGEFPAFKYFFKTHERMKKKQTKDELKRMYEYILLNSI